jgi:hypothetical protein
MTDEAARKRRESAAYNQPLVGVDWSRPENQRWLDVADKIAAHTEAALKETSEALEATAKDAIRFQDKNKNLRAQFAAAEEIFEERLRIMSKMLQYIAFVLTGDEQADSQLAADRIVEERDALKAERDRLKRWVGDLQSGMYVNCVYCGHQYGPGETTPVSMADALKAHVEQCPEHPMSALKAERDQLEGVNFHNGNWIAMAEPELARLKAAVEQARAALEAIAMRTDGPSFHLDGDIRGIINEALSATDAHPDGLKPDGSPCEWFR